MATLKQCDRCKSIYSFAPNIMSLSTGETKERDAGKYELCTTCQTRFDWFMENKLEVKPTPKSLSIL